MLFLDYALAPDGSGACPRSAHGRPWWVAIMDDVCRASHIRPGCWPSGIQSELAFHPMDAVSPDTSATAVGIAVRARA